MPISLPNLDDRRYADLIEEARTLIPNYAPEWTNHNESDPGITLVELFAFLTEMLIYRLNRVTDANLYAFLKLIDGVERKPSDQLDLSKEMRSVVLELRKPHRAVTCEDFEALSLAPPDELLIKGEQVARLGQVARARCVPRRNLEPDDLATRNLEKPGHISVVIVPASTGDDTEPTPSSELLEYIKADLEERRLLTTRVHVVGPRYVGVGVRVTLFLKPDALEKDVRQDAVAALRDFFHPLKGGQGKTGWEFGRDVYVSEIYELLDLLPGVDFVIRSVDPMTRQPLEELKVDDSTRLKRKSTGELIAIGLHPDELVEARIDVNDIAIVSPLELSE